MNKQLIVTALLVLLTLGASAQVKVEVSETVELMAILSRIAGFEEFSGNFAGKYSQDTEVWFAPYKNHSTVAFSGKTLTFKSECKADSSNS